MNRAAPPNDSAFALLPKNFTFRRVETYRRLAKLMREGH
jgi:hypothetical protein